MTGIKYHPPQATNQELKVEEGRVTSGHRTEYLLSPSHEHLKLHLGLEVSCFILQVSKYTQMKRRQESPSIKDKYDEEL